MRKPIQNPTTFVIAALAIGATFINDAKAQGYEIIEPQHDHSAVDSSPTGDHIFDSGIGCAIDAVNAVHLPGTTVTAGGTQNVEGGEVFTALKSREVIAKTGDSNDSVDIELPNGQTQTMTGWAEHSIDITSHLGKRDADGSYKISHIIHHDGNPNITGDEYISFLQQRFNAVAAWDLNQETRPSVGSTYKIDQNSFNWMTLAVQNMQAAFVDCMGSIIGTKMWPGSSDNPGNAPQNYQPTGTGDFSIKRD